MFDGVLEVRTQCSSFTSASLIVCACCVMNDELARCDGGLMFHLWEFCTVPCLLLQDFTITPLLLAMRARRLLQSLSGYITLCILGALSHVVLASPVLYIRVHCVGIFRLFFFSFSPLDSLLFPVWSR